jgi:hypothetical protein
MPVRRKTLFAVLVVSALALVLLPAAASAAFKTQVIVSLKFPAFHGALQSKNLGCESKRAMKLYREKSGRDKLLGMGKSKKSGKWSIPIGKRLISGSYYATVTARGDCKGGKSKVIPIA